MKRLLIISSLVIFTHSKPQMGGLDSQSDSSEDADGLSMRVPGGYPSAPVPHPAVPHPAVPHPAVPHPAVPHPAVPHPAVPLPPHQEECCCIAADQQCFDYFPESEDDLVGEGLIDPRIVNKPHSETKSESEETRVVNRPPAGPGSSSQLNALNACPAGYKTCCYNPSVHALDLSVFGRSSGCISPLVANNLVQDPNHPHHHPADPNHHHHHHPAGPHHHHHPAGPHAGHLTSTGQQWVQGCPETPQNAGKQCGTRFYPAPVPGLSYAQTSPGEFPWNCILLNQNNDFVGTCAIIPTDFYNNNNVPTRKILTAAHKLKDLKERDLLKVRVGEWDATGFNAPEIYPHEEYTVTRIIKHPDMSKTRLDNNLAILYVDRDINLNNPYVNTACLPSCDNQFDFLFSNGTGVRCHVAGWGKDESNGQFQYIPRKVDLSLVPNAHCEAKLKWALNTRQPGSGDRFQLDSSELCAGGQVGKDACQGDGGSPLVCQAQSGRWTVVGLVSWGIGCGSDLPGVYVDISHYREWINAN